MTGETVDLPSPVWLAMIELANRHAGEMQAEIESRFGEADAATLMTVSIATMMGSLLSALGNPHDLPGPVNDLWSQGGLGFRLMAVQ